MTVIKCNVRILALLITFWPASALRFSAEVNISKPKMHILFIQVLRWFVHVHYNPRKGFVGHREPLMKTSSYIILQRKKRRAFSVDHIFSAAVLFVLTSNV